MKICKACCKQSRRSSGYCDKHDYQFKKHGRILAISSAEPNEILIKHDIVEIIICDKKYHEKARAIIDIADLSELKRYRWSLANGYVFNRSVGKLHRFLLKPEKSIQIDHINHNILDNRRSNLRLATSSQNVAHTKLRKHNKSGMKGVSWHKKAEKWAAQAGNVKIGLFTDKIEAAKEYDKEILKLYGEYAITNASLGLLHAR